MLKFQVFTLNTSFLKHNSNNWMKSIDNLAERIRSIGNYDQRL
jgi:hypothetical protein